MQLGHRPTFIWYMYSDLLLHELSHELSASEHRAANVLCLQGWRDTATDQAPRTQAYLVEAPGPFCREIIGVEV